MVPFFTLLFALFAPQNKAPAEPANTPYAPLWLYNGTWHVDKKDQPPGAKPDELLNQCAQMGAYFSCQQTVNGKPSALLIFVLASGTGQYHTQSVMPDGRCGGRGDLSIDGDHWVYSSNWSQGGKTTFYRTTNTFSGKTHIHYEQQESPDNKDWKTTSSGDEVRVSPGRMTVVR